MYTAESYLCDIGNREFEEEERQIDDWRVTPKSILARSLEFAKAGYYVAGASRVVVLENPLEMAYEKARRRIKDLCSPFEGDAAPNSFVEVISLQALEMFRENNMPPPLINPTGDESLLFEFFSADDIYSLDFYNSGEVVFIERKEHKISQVLELNIADLTKTINEISLSYVRSNL